MRVNVYAEELTDQVSLATKEIEGRTFTALRFHLALPASFINSNPNIAPRPATVKDTEQATHYRAPFIHHPGDDDSAAVTFWGKRDMRPLLRKALELLDQHYTHRAPENVNYWKIGNRRGKIAVEGYSDDGSLCHYYLSDLWVENRLCRCAETGKILYLTGTI